MLIRKSHLWVPLIALVALLGASSGASAGHSSFSFGIGYSSHGYHGPRYYGGYHHYHYPRYYYPYYRPVYYHPPVVYSSVYYQPSPPVVYTYTQPAPVYTTPTYPYATAGNTAQTVVYNPPPAPAAPAAPAATSVAPPSQPASVDGWALLSSDQARTALDAFALEAERSPNLGLPKVGYALASAVIGDDAKAAWAMRNAIQAEPDALNRVQLSAGAHNQVRAAVARYDQRITSGYTRADDLFMVGALRYIEGDYANADAAITKAAAQGDTHATTATLKTLIDVKLNRNWKYNYGSGNQAPAPPAPAKP